LAKIDALAHRKLAALRQTLVMVRPAAGFGLVEQAVDLLQLLEHGRPVLLELGRAGVEAGAKGRGE
jgi:hypothetical protein